MNSDQRDELLKQIARTGYNVGIGACKNFATYDIVNKIPQHLGTVSTVIGVFALVFESLGTKPLSALFIVFGIIGLTISQRSENKEQFIGSARELLQIRDELERLYSETKTANEDELAHLSDQLRELRNRSHQVSNHNQIAFSDWYAHYKFFWQWQIDWIDEQLKFRFLRDKIPLTFSIFVVVLLVVSLYFLVDKGSCSIFIDKASSVFASIGAD